MFKLAIEVCFEIHFGLIRAIFLSLGSRNPYTFFGTPDTLYNIPIMGLQKIDEITKRFLVSDSFAERQYVPTTASQQIFEADTTDFDRPNFRYLS